MRNLKFFAPFAFSVRVMVRARSICRPSLIFCERDLRLHNKLKLWTLLGGSQPSRASVKRARGFLAVILEFAILALMVSTTCSVAMWG
jgi:hypothetical protein